MLFISLKNNRTLKLYAEAPVDDLTELNLDLGDSTVQFSNLFISEIYLFYIQYNIIYYI